MKKQSLKTLIKSIICFILLTTLLMADFIVLGQGIAIAIYESLETQGNTTNVKNVEFDSYFLNNGEKVHYKECDLDSEESIFINISVKESGALKDAKIRIENSNFELVTDNVQNSYIKNINSETNEIELNEIIYQNDITIEIPIEFKKEESFTDDYFERENTIFLAGIYADEKEQEVSGQIKTRILWKQQVDVNLSDSIEKYIDLGNNGILLQQNVTTQVIDNKLPRENEILNLQVPSIDEQIPEEVVVLLNGEKLSEEKVTYNIENKSLEIRNETKGIWGLANNEYKIIYKYSADIEFTTKTVTLQTNIKTKLYAQEEVQKQEEQTIEINQLGNVVSSNKQATNSVYKGYMYANSSNDTSFTEYNYIEISDVSSVGSLEIEKEQEVFTNEQQAFDISGKILYKATTINKADFARILGPEGEILIKDKYGNILNVINQDTEVNESGNIWISYDGEVDYIKIVTSKPINEGIISIANARAIKGETGYTKEQLKNFSKLLTSTKISNNLSEEISQAEIILNDTQTEASIEISNNNLSTLQNNENVQLLVTLKSNTAQYDLYKNPNIEIVFPKELEVNVKSITQMNKQEELCIVNPKLYSNENGEQVINMQLQGEQTTFENDINGGIQVSIIADISIDKIVPSKQRQIIMNYTNENRAEGLFTSTTPVKLNSKYGVLTVNRLSGYNHNNDITECIDNNTQTASLDIATEKKVARQEVTIMNNYEIDITDVTLIGRLPKIGTSEERKFTFAINLLSNVNVNGKSAKVYYSENMEADKDSDTWKEEVEDFSKIKSFMIVLDEGALKPQEVVSISYDLVIPENLEANQTSYSNLELEYNYLGSKASVNSNIVLQTSQASNSLVRTNAVALESGELSYSVIARSGGKVLSDDEEVYEGQGIEYEVTLINSSNKIYKNINIKATNTNAIYYDGIKRPADMQPEGATETLYVTYLEENEELQEKQTNIDSIQPGETKTFTYQISVKEVEGEDEVVENVIEISGDNLEKVDITGVTLNIKQADLKLSLRNDYEEEIEILTESDLPVELGIKNISGTSMENVIVEFPIPDEVVFSTDGIYIEADSKYEFVEYSNRSVKFKITKMEADEEIKINVGLTAGKMGYETATMDTTMRFFATANNKKYTSNDIHRTIYQYKTLVTAEQTASVADKSYLNDGDKVTFTFTIENKGMFDTELNIYDKIPEGLVVSKAYFIKNGEKQEIDFTYQSDDEDNTSFFKSNNIDEEIKLSTNEKISLMIETYVNINAADEREITNYAEINGIEIDNFETNKIVYYLNGVEEDNDDDGNDGKNSVGSKYSISGTVWLDKNKNGMRDSTENHLPNMEVVLVDSTTGEIAKDEDGEEFIVRTQDDGEYNFEDIEQGTYIVIFKYDATKYRITEYQKEGVSDSTNSDVISKEITLNGQNIQAAITGTINLNEDANNIDAGFIEGETFDLKLEKYITRLIVQDSTGTKVASYNDAQLVRTEIDAKTIANATVILEYNIRITNEGDIPGYASEVVDYMPSDLKFISETNKNWYQGTDGYLHTKELANEIINPGESKAITLILVKNMTQNNAGTSINTAEIEKVSNSFSMQDTDSTPGNKVSGEDDMSTAEAIISIRTGAVATIIGLILSIAVIIAIAMFFIKKKVLETK